MLCSIFSSSLRLSLLLGTALLGDIAAAVCTNWTHERSRMDDNAGFSMLDLILVDVLVCPANAAKDCYFTRRSYDITDKRDLFPTTGSTESLGLSDEETDAITKLAQDGFNKESGAKPREFLTRNGTVTIANKAEDSLILQVKPGKNGTLFWVPFHIYSTGILSGCSNETLNNMTVTATAPYLTQDEKQNNMTVLAGTWRRILANAANSTDGGDGKSGVASLQTATSSMVGMFLMLLWLIVL